MHIQKNHLMKFEYVGKIRCIILMENNVNKRDVYILITISKMLYI